MSEQITIESLESKIDQLRSFNKLQNEIISRLKRLRQATYENRDGLSHEYPDVALAELDWVLNDGINNRIPQEILRREYRCEEIEHE